MFLDQLKADGRDRTDYIWRYPNPNTLIKAAAKKGIKLVGFENLSSRKLTLVDLYNTLVMYFQNHNRDRSKDQDQLAGDQRGERTY